MRRNALVSLALGLCPLVALAQPIPRECRWRQQGEHVFFHCKIDLTVLSNGKLRVSREPFPLPPGIPVKLVWRLSPAPFHFAEGDGILLRNASGEFTDPCASGTDDGTCTTVVRPRVFKWFVRNSGPFEEPYCVAVRDNAGRRLTFDPTIVNSFVFESGMGLKSTKVFARGRVDIPQSSCDAVTARKP